ncbi:DUF1801 domain-containing protein [Ensifer sp. 4252]|uniref:DUF1801 domain-containing protein n=1 Tax=Ensifer sp. 4252 TaxID=3373915 RepID=UPI003D1938BC
MDKAVDAFIEDKVQPEHRPIVEAFRALIRKVAPDVKEGMRGGTEAYYGVPVYRLKRDIIAISPNKKGVNFAFSKGVLIEDKYGLLQGLGKVNRNVLVRKMDEFNPEALAYYIGQAVKIDMA